MNLEPRPAPAGSTTASSPDPTVDSTPATAGSRAGLAVVLGVLACAGCCATPLLIPLGLLSVGGAAAATTGLTVVAVVLFGLAVLLGIHSYRTRRAQRTAPTAEAHAGGCGSGHGCSCGT